MLTHSSSPATEKPFKCSLNGCDKAFSLAHQLKRHLLVHDRIISESSSICGSATSSCSSETDASFELQPTPKRSRKTFFCGVENCTFTCVSKRELKKHHSEVHERSSTTSSKDFLCTQDGCGKSFTRKFARDKHIQTVHLDIRPFECRICQSSFGHKHLLKRHMENCHEGNTNTGTVPNSEVQEDLIDASSLILGLSGLAYEAERRFGCPNCRSRFLRQYDLDRHLKGCTVEQK